MVRKLLSSIHPLVKRRENRPLLGEDNIRDLQESFSSTIGKLSTSSNTAASVRTRNLHFLFSFRLDDDEM